MKSTSNTLNADGSAEHSSSERNTFVLECIGLLGLLSVTAFYLSNQLLNHDVAWYLTGTRRWLEGATLYADVIEVNPPFIFYLMAPVIFVADLLRVSEKFAFVGFICLITAVSLIWSAHLLQRQSHLAPSQRHVILAASFVGLIFVQITYFGQRDHIMLILALPYFMSQIFIRNPQKLAHGEQSALGLYAGFGIILKHYFLLAPFALILISIYQNRSIRPLFLLSHWAIGCVCLFYVVFVYVFHGEYFSNIVPMGQLVYEAYNRDVIEVLFLNNFHLCFLALAAMYLTHNAVEDETKRVSERLIALCLAFGLAYVIQRKGWSYHFNPFAAILVLCSFWIFFTEWRARAKQKFAMIFSAWIIIVALIKTVIDGTYSNYMVESFDSPLPSNMPVERFLVLSSNIWPAYPLANELSARHTSPYPALWPVPGAVRKLAATDCHQNADMCLRLSAILDEVRRHVVESFLAGTPQLVIVDSRPQKGYFADQPFDFIDFLSQDPRFRTAWQDYKKDDNIRFYETWVRK